jgi:hypothetical protein
MVARVIRTVMEHCVHRHRFESIQRATRVIGDWISFYNGQRFCKLGSLFDAFSHLASPGLVGRGYRSARALQRSRLIHNMNPLWDFRNEASSVKPRR